MKASLSATGVLSVVPENPTEEYALRKWSDEAFIPGQGLDLRYREEFVLRGSRIVVRTDEPKTTD